MADIALAELWSDVCDGDDTVSVTFHRNSIDDPFVLISMGDATITCSDILRGVIVETLNVVSEQEYNQITMLTVWTSQLMKNNSKKVRI